MFIPPLYCKEGDRGSYLASITIFNGAVDLSASGVFFDLGAFVVVFFTFGERKFDLGDAVWVPVKFERDQRDAFFFHLGMDLFQL